VIEVDLETKPLFITGPCTSEDLDQLVDALPPKELCIMARLAHESSLTRLRRE